jgi:ketosteroid isomerase-like protein
MLSTLVDEATIVYVVLILATAGCVLAWRNTRRKSLLAGAGVGILLLVAFAIVCHFLVTDQRKIELALQDAAAAVKANDIPRIAGHLARDFHFRSQDRAAFLEKAKQDVGSHRVEEVVVWDFKFENVDSAKGTAHISFRAKLHGGGVPEGAFYRVTAELVREADGQWKLRTFDIFNPAVDTNSPISIPGY